MAKGKIAGNNERVIVNRDFSIHIPEGYNYSLDTGEINDNRVLVFIKTERNDYFDKEFGDFDEFDLDAPFGAPQCCAIVPLRNLGVQLDLSDSNIREAMRNMFQPIATMFGGTCTAVKETKDMLVYFSKFNGKEKNTHFLFVTPENIYNGQIWLNDISTQKERERIAKEWLNSIENYVLTDADKIPSKPFVVPTYNEKKREQMGTLTIAVPDQMKTLVSESEKERHDFIAIENLKKEFAFLAINNEFKGAFNLYSDAEFIIKAANDGIKPMPNLVDLWGEEKKVERKKALTDLVKNSLQGNPYKFVFKDLANELSVVYTQVGESTDNIEQWANFFAIFFHKDAIVQVNVHIKAVLDIPAMEKAVALWVASAKPASKDEIDEYNKQVAAIALGALAGKNGKIDGAKATQLFFEDIFFFVKGQIQAKGKHHTLHGLQINGAVLDNFPQIKNNPAVYGNSLTELLNFVEEDELLVLDEECVHFEFDKLNKIDPPIINGTEVNVKGAKIGKGLSGIRAFLLIAWHMAKIVEGEENKYVVALDQNMYRGIPDAQAYICQLIKRLREYNDRHDAFEVVFASTFNCDGGLDGAISGRNPIQGVQNGFEPVCVAENENPYEAVQKKIEEAKKDGVWQKWERGKNSTDDDFDESFVLPTFDDNFDDEFIDESPEVDSKGRIAPSDVKTSSKVKNTIRKIGQCEGKPSIKGKIFVLTEVMYPDIMENYISKNGGEVKSSTVLATDYLIIGDDGSGDTTKAKRAIELNQTRGKNIKALSENDFWFMMSDEYKKVEKKPSTNSTAKTTKKTNVSTTNSSVQTNNTSTKVIVDKNEAEMKKALEEVKSKHRSAEREFDQAKSEIERMTSTSINIYYDDVESRIIEAISASLEASRNLYTVCQALVLALDKVCKPLLVDEISHTLVQKIADEISSLNEDSDIDNDYTGSFEGVSFGDVGNIHFEATDEAKKIERFWITKASSMKKTAEENAYVSKHKIAAKDIEKHKKYETAKETLKYATTSAKVKSARSSFVALKGYLDSEEYIKKCDAKLPDLEEKEKKAAQEKAEKEAVEAKRQAEKDSKDKLVADRKRKYQHHLKGMMCAIHENFVCTTENGIPSQFAKYMFDSSGSKNNISRFSNIKSIVITHDGIVGLRTNGTCISTPGINPYSYIQDCNSWRNIKQIAAGDHHIVGLREDGTCVANRVKWNTGYGYDGQCDVSSWSDIKYVTCGGSFTVGLKQDGSVVVVGETSYSGAGSARNWKNIEIIEAHYDGVVAVDKNGKVHNAGRANISNISSAKNIIDIAVCRNEAYALLADGTVVGKDCKNIKDVVAIVAGFDLYMLKKDGSIEVKTPSRYSFDKKELPKSLRLIKDYDEYIDRIEKEEKAKQEEIERRRKEREEMIKRQTEYRNKGLCQHCGGTFKKGWFSTKCTSCGKKKDYE